MKVASTFATCLVAVALATLAGCNHQQDANTSSSLRPTSESMRTVCVGRYTVDLPRSADHFKMAQSFNGIRIDARSPSNAQQMHEAILQAAPVAASMATGSLSSPPIDMPEGEFFSCRTMARISTHIASVHPQARRGVLIFRAGFE